MGVTTLSFDDVGAIVAVLSDAFRDYPVMRYVLGPGAAYEKRLLRLVELFVSGRAYRADPMLGLRDGSGALVGAAVATPRVLRDPPARFVALRETIWGELGLDARARYETFVRATRPVLVGPHHHLNMIGVRRSHQGQGLARRLLEAVHELAHADAESRGVSLTTEVAENVALYEYFGYAVTGHTRVADGVETWTLFRGRG
jgi:GNAT superfamily N-acetyltransferase